MSIRLKPNGLQKRLSADRPMGTKLTIDGSCRLVRYMQFTPETSRHLASWAAVLGGGEKAKEQKRARVAFKNESCSYLTFCTPV